MRVECFEFKRCCCCVPLRYGLLALGYFKLAFSLLFLLPFFITNADAPPVASMSRLQYVGVIAILILIFLAILADLALTIVFLVGGHKKSTKLLKVFNYFSYAVLIILVLMYIIIIGLNIYSMARYVGFINSVIYVGFINSVIFMRVLIIFGALCIGFVVYVILMNKSEIAKLEEKGGFAFSNIAQEAECKMVDGEGNIIENDIKITELENGVRHENDTRAYAENNETELIENVENNHTKHKPNGNYVKLV